MGRKVVALDLFDSPKTCEKLWHRLLTGVAPDAVEEGDGDTTAGPDAVKRLLDTIRDLSWEKVEPVCEGEEYRAQSDSRVHASALLVGGTLVHASVVRG